MSEKKLITKIGTPIVWTNTGGDKLLNGKALAATTGRLGAFYDRGANAAPVDYLFRLYTAWAVAPVVNTELMLAIFASDGTHQDCGVAFHETNDAALTLVQINAAAGYLGSAVCHTADTAEKGNSWLARIVSRYFAPGVFNTAAQTLANVDGATAVVATPFFTVTADDV